MTKPRMTIRSLRIARGLTLAELARRCEVSVVAVHQWETGVVFP